MVTQIASASAVASRMTTRSMMPAYQRADVLRRQLVEHRRVEPRALVDRRLAEADRDRVGHQHEERADTPTVHSSARGIDVCGSWLSSPIEAAASKPTNSRMPEQHAVEDGAQRRGRRVEHLPACCRSAPPLTMIARARIVITVNETAAKPSMRPIASRMPT